MAKIILQQLRSSIGSTKRQKETLKALGLKKTYSKVEHEPTPQVLGMVEKVKHLLAVENIK